MHASCFIGRVGGLAVALGIGWAGLVSGVPAWASPADSESATDAADAAEDSRRGREPESSRRLGRLASATGGDAGRAEAKPPRSRSGINPPAARKPRPGAVPARVRAGSATPVDVPAPAAPDRVADGESVVQTASIDESPVEPGRAEILSVTVAGPATAAPVLLAAPPAPASGDLDSVFVPRSGVAPGAPVGSPMPWAVLAAARRELDGKLADLTPPAAESPSGELVDLPARPLFGGVVRYTFFHKSPTATPSQSPGQNAGVVTGNLNAETSNGAPLVFRIAQAPEKGSVVIGEDGSYAYTADPAFGFVGGIDSFRVTIDNSGSYRLRGIAGVVQSILRTLAEAAGLRQPDAITVTVPVTISAMANGAPVFGDPPTSESIDQTTGVISGRFIADDPEGSVITFGLAGSVDSALAAFALDSETGEFTFTPTALARFNAAANETDRTLPIVVSASDGENITTTNYLATVVPQYLDADGTLSLADLDTLARVGAVGAMVSEAGFVNTLVGAFTSQKVTSTDDALKALNRIADLLGAPGGFTGEFNLQTTDFIPESGGVPQAFYRLTQKVNGVPVLGSEVILSALKDGTATGVFSGLDPRIYAVDTTPDASIDESAEVISAASRILLNAIESPPSGLLEALDFEEKLVIYGMDPAVSPALAWLVTVRETEPASADSTPSFVGTTYYIYANGADAGTLLAEDNGIEDAIPGSEQQTETATGLKGKSFSINYTARPPFDLMWDQVRNISVYPLTFKNQAPGGALAYRCVDESACGLDWLPKWNTSYVSALGNTATTYDFYTGVLNSTDLPYNLSVGVSLINLENAYWYGVDRYFVYGNDNEGALDVVGHEKTHAVISAITGLPGGFQGAEGGGLNEAYGDIIGSIIEGKGKSDPGRWLFAEDHANPKPYRDMRVIEAPPAGNPTEPHALATTFDFAAYTMMTDSRTTGISDQTWAQIFYSSLKRLPVNATFDLARSAVIGAAWDQGIYGDQLKAIADAFNAAGIRSEDPRVKITLRWGPGPADLDAHLTVPASITGSVPIDVSPGMSRYPILDGEPSISLDYDASNGFGPEAITISKLEPGEYYFSVYDWSNRESTDSTALSRSGATVEVFTPDEFEIPPTLFGYIWRYLTGQIPASFEVDGSSGGTRWDVFKLTIPPATGGAVPRPVITPIDAYAYLKAPNRAPVPGTSVVDRVDALDGLVTGSVTATDPDDDPVTYSAPAATASGEVRVDPTSGKFFYVPNPADRAAVTPSYAITPAITGLDRPSRVLLGADNTAYVVNAGDVSVFDTQTNAVTDSFATAPYTLGLVEANPAGTRAYFTTYGVNTVGVISPGDGTVGQFRDFGNRTPTAIGFSLPADGDYVYVATTEGGRSGSLSVINASDGTESTDFSYDGVVTSLAYRPRSSMLYAPGIDTAGRGVVNVFNFFTRSVTQISGLQAPNDIVFTPDGKRMYVTTNSEAGGSLWVYSTETNSVLADIALTPGLAGYLTMSPTGDRVYVSTWNPAEGRSSVVVIPADGAEILLPAVRIIDLQSNSMPYVAVSSDGNRLYVADKESTLSAIDAKSGGSDSFVVTVADGRGGAASIPVTVPIAPLITSAV